jgi:hypothetical protein
MCYGEMSVCLSVQFSSLKLCTGSELNFVTQIYNKDCQASFHFDLFQHFSHKCLIVQNIFYIYFYIYNFIPNLYLCDVYLIKNKEKQCISMYFLFCYIY